MLANCNPAPSGDGARFGIAVAPGTCLSAGDRIGSVGATGNATGPHLHFELRVRGAAVDPLTGLG